MRKFFFLLLTAAVFASCSSSEAPEVKGATDAPAAPVAVNLPYTVPRTPDWEKGNPAHVAVAMNTLKAFADNDMTAMQQYLADTVAFLVNNMSFRGTRDSLMKIMTDYRSRMTDVNIRMQDYESVKSKSRGEEWVSLWYTETNTMKDGRVDSAMVMDDIQLVGGKVAVIDSKARGLGNQ